MQLRHAFFILIMALSLWGCASSETSPDVEQDPSLAPEPAVEASSAPETNESDVNQPQALAETTPEPLPETPAATNELPPPTDEPPPAVTNEAPAKITGLDFQSQTNGGTVIIRTDRPVQYATRRNETTNQFVIELQNTKVPKKFRRPYNTKEFGGPIASINAYQAKNADSLARIVVQMKDASEPGVLQEGNLISIAGSGGTPAPQVAETEAEEPAVSQTEEATETAGEENILSNKSITDFLIGNNKFYGRKISIELKDSDIRDVFRLISEESGLNIIVGDDVTGKISLKLRQIPWDQALAVILQSKQLGYVKQGNILRIAKLQTLQAESDAAKNVIESQKLLQPLRVQIFPISYAKSEDIESQAKDFLSTRGKAKSDRRTNTLVVTDIDENIQRIKNLIQRLDTQTPQVLIEAKIVEARESFSRIIGVNWGFSGNPTAVGKNRVGSNVNMTPQFSAGAPSTASAFDLGISVGTLDVFGDINASLRLLEIEKLVKVISAPRIVTLDRVDAKIEQTTQFPVFSSTTNATTGQTNSSVSFQDVKLQMSVRPQITIEGGIIMDLNVLREFPEPAVRVGGSEARPVNKRHAQTQVLVENGDTVVIGGIYQSDVSESETGTPWLRKIPLLGALFRQRGIERDKNELVIFLTPRILNREKAFTQRIEGGEGT